MAGPFSGIAPLSAFAPVGAAGGAPVGNRPDATGADFRTALRDALRAWEAAERQAEASAGAFALGLPVPPHRVMLDLARAELIVETAVAVRNKAIEAYQELMRMPL